MPKMTYLNPLLILLILSSFLNFAHAEESDFTCMASEIKIPYADGKTKTEKVEICTNKDRNSLRSKGCLKLECLPKEKLKRIKFSDVVADSGSPGFKICHAIGGKAELIEFKADDQWYSLDRCRLGKEFVNPGVLIDEVSE